VNRWLSLAKELVCEFFLTYVSANVTVDPDGSFASLLAWRLTLSESFTWLLQGSKAVFLFFLMFTVYKYGHIKLGRKRDKPEFAQFGGANRGVSPAAQHI
jgi:choline-glycine betaine transporter